MASIKRGSRTFREMSRLVTMSLITEIGRSSKLLLNNFKTSEKINPELLSPTSFRRRLEVSHSSVEKIRSKDSRRRNGATRRYGT